MDTFLKDTLFIFSSMTHKHVADLIPKERLYLFDSMANHKKDFGQIVAPSVGELSYGIMLTLGFTDIYLLGLDLALDPETNQRYADKEHKLNLTEEDTNIHSAQLQNTIINVKGNFIDTVSTLPIFKMSIDSFKYLSMSRKKNTQSVYNLCNGAMLEGSIPLHIEDITELKSFDKDDTYKKLFKEFFDKNSENHATKNDIDYLNTLLIEAQKLRAILIEYSTTIVYDTIDDNMINFGNLIEILQGKDSDTKTELHAIMTKYNQFITGYVIAFFNTNEIQEQNKHFEYIFATYIQQSQKIINVYVQTVENYKIIAEYNLEKIKKVKE